MEESIGVIHMTSIRRRSFYVGFLYSFFIFAIGYNLVRMLQYRINHISIQQYATPIRIVYMTAAVIYFTAFVLLDSIDILGVLIILIVPMEITAYIVLLTALSSIFTRVCVIMTTIVFFRLVYIISREWRNYFRALNLSLFISLSFCIFVLTSFLSLLGLLNISDDSSYIICQPLTYEYSESSVDEWDHWDLNDPDLQLLSAETYYTLDEYEKIKCLSVFASYELNFMGFNQEKKIRLEFIEDLPESVLGCYSREYNTIYIKKSLLENRYEVMTVLCHELFHAYEHAFCLGEVPELFAGTNGEIKDRWSYEFDHYVHGYEDYERYCNLSIEKWSRMYESSAYIFIDLYIDTLNPVSPQRFN